MPEKKPKELPDLVRRSVHRSPHLKAAFDDGVKQGRKEARHEMLTYLAEEFIMDEGLERGSPKYEAALDVIRMVSKKFR